MYELIFDDEALNFLDTLPQSIKERLFKKITLTKENPFLFFVKLQGRNDYKLRVGDYRVIADINNKTKTIEITLIGHRKNVYDNLS